MFLTVTSTELRKNLAEQLREVEISDRKVIIERNGKKVGVLVSMKDFERVWQAEGDAISGPVNPASGRRRGGLIRPGEMADWLLRRG
ncbi:MAG: type II toxin-antitoxin system Phd/YefM family antitoxin [Paracoccaceae bacterium]